MTWKNVPICDECWNDEEPDRIPHRLRNLIGSPRCYSCKKPTDSGIMVRRNV